MENNNSIILKYELDHTFKFTIKYFIIELLFVGLIFYIFADSKIPHNELLQWCAIAAGAIGARAVLAFVSQMKDFTSQANAFMSAQVVLSLVSGGAWGYFYFEFHQLFTAFHHVYALGILIAVSAQAMVTMSGSLFSFYAFIIPIYGMILFSNMALRTDAQIAIAALMGLSAVLMCVLHFLNRQSLTEKVKLIVEHDEINEQLSNTEGDLIETKRELEGVNLALDRQYLISKTDKDGKITFVNDRFCHVTKYTKDELIGQTHKLINSGYHSKDFINELWRAINSNEDFSQPIKNRAKDKSTFWVDSSFVSFVNKEGDKEFIAVQTDVTERMEAIERMNDLEASFSSLIESIDFAIFKLNTSGAFTLLNKSGLSLFGYETMDDALDKDFFAIIPEKQVETIQGHFNEALQGQGAFFSITLNLENKKQKFRTCFLPLVKSNKVYAVIGYLINITKDEENEKALALASKVYKYSSQAMIVTNAKQKIIAINPAFTELTGYTAKEVYGKDSQFFLSDLYDAERTNLLERGLRSKGQFKGEFRNKSKSGAELTFEVSMGNIGNKEGQVYRTVALITDLTDYKKSKEIIRDQERKIDKYTKEDSFRGTLSKPVFNYIVSKHLAEAPRDPQETFAIALLEIKHLEEIAQKHTHKIAHLYMEELTNRINACIRKTDYIAKITEDEFAILITKLKVPEDAGIVVEKIYRSFLEPVVCEKIEFKNDFNFGISIYPTDGDTIELLEQKADLALYKTKENEGGSFNFYNDEIHKRFAEQQDIFHLVNGNFDKNFTLHCQPIFTVTKDKPLIKGGEFLLRPKELSSELLNISDIIKVAQKRKMILDFGSEIIRHAFSMIQSLKAEHSEGTYSINLAISQVGSDSFIENISELTQKFSIDPQEVCFELDEADLIEHEDEAQSLIKSLHDNGFNIAIDSFSKGYTLLAKIKNFPVNTIKIDPSFTRNMMTNKHTEIIVKNIIDLAKGLKLRVIAKGVETKEQYFLLNELGCEEAQGYFLGKELEFDEFKKLL